MKKLLSIVAFVFCTFLAIGQNAPQMFNYQGVARDNAGNTLANQDIGLIIEIRIGGANGPAAYQEEHFTTTNAFGLFNIQVGNGIPVGSFSDVDWASNPHWMLVRLDADGSGGAAVYEEMGTSQLLSVPYALYANSSSGSLNDAYSNGRTVNATDGAVKVEGTDGLLVTGTHGSGADIEASGAGTRMFFNPKKSAFRAGFANGMEWDNDNVGDYSMSTGFQNVASGTYSIALGERCMSTGEASIAMGSETNAFGQHAVSMGYYSVASGTISVAIGSGAQASGYEAVALGSNSWADGDKSFAVGFGAQATGLNAVALGDFPVASGDYSFAFGKEAEASGGNSFALGNNATASASNAFAIGRDAEATGDNAIAIGRSAEASGTYSFAAGTATWAFGTKSTAFGDGSHASGPVSTAFGEGTTASGYHATSFGRETTASGNQSTAMGDDAAASGDHSTAIGYGVSAPSAEEMVIGSHNTVYTPASTTSWDSADRLFVVGNGTSSSDLSDALVILKNGNTGIGESNPTQLLHLSGESGVDGIKFPDGTEQTTAYTGTGGTTLDAAYDQGGAGAGRTIDASDGAVFIDGTDGLIVTGNTGIGISTPTAQLHVANGDVIFDRNTNGTAGTRTLTISGKRDGSANDYAGIQFRNEDTNDYLGAAIYSRNASGTDSGDLRMYVSNNSATLEGLRIRHTGDVYVPESDAGIIMKSPNGNCWKLTVSNNGAPVFTSVTCP